MNPSGYRVMFAGELLRGHERATAVSRLAVLLGRNATELEPLFSGHPHVLRRAVGEGDAKRLVELFHQAGARAYIEAPPAEPPPRPAPRRQPAPTISASLGQRVGLVRALVVTEVIALSGALLVLGLLGAWLALTLGYAPWSPWLPLPVHLLLSLLLGALIALVLKPLVPLEARLPLGIAIRREQEPVLFDLIDYVCEALRLPAPQELRIDAAPRIAAGPRPGAYVSVGLPVLATATTAQFAGLLAQALAHHGSDLSSRCARRVQRFNAHLHAAVHQRDGFDRGLERLSRSALSPLAWTAARCLALTAGARRLLNHVLDESQGASAMAMRALERHRDRHAAFVVGDDGFAALLQQQRLLKLAGEQEDRDIQALHRSGRPLPADLPADLAARMAGYVQPDQLKACLTLAETMQEPVALFHLADAERIQAMAAAPRPALLTCAAPAQALLKGYGALLPRVVFLHYRNRLGLAVTPEQVQPAPSEDRRTAERFCSAYLPLMPIAPPLALPVCAPLDECIAKARSARALMAGHEAQARLIQKRYRALAAELFDNLIEEQRLRIPPGRLVLPGQRVRLEAVQQNCRDREAEQDQAFAALVAHGERLARRLAVATALLRHPELPSRLPSAQAMAQSATRLAEILGKTAPLMPQLRLMHSQIVLLEYLLSLGERRGLKDLIEEQESDLKASLTAIRVALRNTPPPFESDTRLRTMLEAVQARVTPMSRRHSLLCEAALVLEDLLELQTAMVARMVELALTVEKALGI